MQISNGPWSVTLIPDGRVVRFVLTNADTLEVIDFGLTERSLV